MGRNEHESKSEWAPISLSKSASGELLIMKIAIFSSQPFDIYFLTQANQDYGYELVFYEVSLNIQTAILASGFVVVSCFVTDQLDAKVLNLLSQQGTQLIALRSAGFNHVDLAAARQLSLTVARVPAYSPYAVAEFAVGLILSKP